MLKCLYLFLSLAVSLLGSAVWVAGEDILTNQSVIEMVAAGLPEDVIIAKIASSQTNFDLSTAGLVKLNQAKVSSAIIKAMMAPKGVSAPAPLAASATPVPPGAPTEIGVYYKKKDKWEEMLPEVVNWKTGGVLKNIASAGMVKGDVNGRINGPNSRNSVKTPLEFLIYAAEGVAITEYQLLRLRAQKDGREFRTVTGGVLHVSGGATRDLVPFEGKKIASRMYVITLLNLGAGEYGFLAPGSVASSHASAQLGKMYTFRLLE